MFDPIPDINEMLLNEGYFIAMEGQFPIVAAKVRVSIDREEGYECRALRPGGKAWDESFYCCRRPFLWEAIKACCERARLEGILQI